MSFLNKMERKFGKYCIEGLMKYIVFGQAIVYILTMAQPEVRDFLTFEPTAIMHGDIWRIITFMFIPVNASSIWIVFILLLYYSIGMTLEREWGTFKFNVYYFTGILGTVVLSFIFGIGASSTFVNLSLFLAFARLYPNYEFLLFFILPVKVKYLAWLEWGILLFTVVTGYTGQKIIALVSVLNYFLFFGKEIVANTKKQSKSHVRKKQFNSKMNRSESIHKCAVCGITEKDDPDMVFRYCSQCEGDYEYCSKHLKDHKHKTKVIEFSKKEN